MICWLEREGKRRKGKESDMREGGREREREGESEGGRERERGRTHGQTSHLEEKGECAK